VEDRGHPQLPAEMTGGVGEGAEGGRGGAEQERVNQSGIVIKQGVEGMGQGEDDVEVLDGEQLGAPGIEPACCGQALALGAMPVAAGVVAEALGPAVITDVAMAAEGGGAAGLDGVHGPALGAVEAVDAPKRLAVSAEDLGDIDTPAAAGRRRLGERRPGRHRLRGGRLG